MSQNVSSRREFLLYWAGVFVVALSIVSILMSLSGLVTGVLSYNCYIPVLSPMLGMSQSQPVPMPITAPNASTSNASQVYQFSEPNIRFPYYCSSPMVPVIQFTFNLLSGLVFMAVGVYMMFSGRRR